jgi:hypothetical protein
VKVTSPCSFPDDGVLTHGVTPLGLAVRHRCYTPGCVNPAHVSYEVPESKH